MNIMVVNVNTSQSMTDAIGEASAQVAMLIGRAYSVVTTLQRSVPPIEDRLRLAGLWDRCAGLFSGSSGSSGSGGSVGSGGGVGA